MLRESKPYRSSSMLALGAILAVAYLALLSLVLIDGSARDLRITVAIGAGVIPLAVIMILLSRFHVAAGIVVWDILLAAGLVVLSTYIRNDVMPIIALIQAIVYILAAFLILVSRFQTAGTINIVVGITSIPFGVFSILFGAWLRTVHARIAFDRSVPEPAPGEGWIACHACKQTFMGEPKHGHRCPLCGAEL
ncbi:MAG: hypothetical protein PVJ57_15375 [Phycisphaerae bacterium]